MLRVVILFTLGGRVPFAVAAIARLHSIRYLGTSPTADRPTWPSLPSAFVGHVQASAVGNLGSLWLLGGDGAAWCCTNSSNLSGSCALSSFQLSGASHLATSQGLALGLASDTALALADLTSEPCGVMEVNRGSSGAGYPSTAAIDGSGGLWVGGSTGSLWRLAPEVSSSVVQVASFDGSPVTALAIGMGADSIEKVAVATQVALYLSFPDEPHSQMGWRHDWLGALFDYGLTTALFTNNATSLWLGGDGALYHVDTSDNVAGGGVHRFGGRDGAPMTGGVRCIAPWIDGQGLAFATSLGVALLLNPSEFVSGNAAAKWRLLAGDRYLAGGSSSVTAVSSHDGLLVAVFDNTTALSVLYAPNNATIAAKAEIFASYYPRHLLWHSLVSAVSLASPGDISNPVPYPGDNNGLFAGCNLVIQSLRFATTGDSAAKQAVGEAFSGLYQLNEITGVPGYPARSLAAPGDTIDKDNKWGWNPSPVANYEGWLFKGNTSSDEILAHMLAYPIYHDLAADEGDEKALALNTTNQIMTNILDNNLTLIDADGQKTVWGFWDPETLNGDPEHYSERGAR